MTSKKKRSPRLDIRNLDNQISRYPTTARTGDRTRTGNRPIFYNDMDTFVYGKATDSFAFGQIVSLPTSLPSGSKYLQSELTSSIFVPGNSIRDNELWITPTRQFETIGPFIESSLFEQDIKETSFYQTGSAISEFGLGFKSNLGSKTKIAIEVAISTAVQLQPESASIYYLNNHLGRFEEIASNIRHKPYPNINFWETRLFNNLGNNILSSAVNDVLNLGHIPNLPAEADTLRQAYLDDNSSYAFSNVGRLMSLVNTQSALIDSAFEATSSQYIQMDRYISQPFMVEKIIMEIPIKAGPGWINDYTRFVRLSAINGYRTDPFDTGGPAVTFGLINQLNKNNRELILSATIIPDGDNFYDEDFSPLYDERFSSGFLSFGKPAYVAISDADSTFTGTIHLEMEPRVSNGITSLGFVSRPGPYADYPKNQGDSFRHSFAISTNPFGRGMRGSAAGRSAFGKEYAVPSADPASSLFTYFPTAPDEHHYNDVTLFNYEKSAVSPYILFPQDKFVFSVSKYRSCAAQSSVINSPPHNFNSRMLLNEAHDIWMNTGNIKITMYGSMIREDMEFHDTLNSRLDTNAVHEIIGNADVDEWDVGSRQEFTGSINSQFMSGTTDMFLAQPNGGGSGISQTWSRRSVIDSTNFSHLDRFSTSIYDSENKINLFEKVSFFKDTKLVSVNEQFYDSMIPRFDELFSREGVTAPFAAIVGLGNMLIVLDYISIYNPKYSVVEWSKSFPFEPKYSGLTRTKVIDSVIAPKNSIASTYYPARGVGVYWPVDEQIALDLSPLGTNDNTSWADFRNNIYSGLRYKDLINILYGSGNRNNVRKGAGSFLYAEYPNSYYGSTNGPEPRTTKIVSPATAFQTPDYGYQGRTYRGTLIRGWKYGLINGYELQTSAIFKRNHYGQFRDMLEQRLDSKFHDGFSILPSPVSVHFIGPKNATVKPENTFSSNLSFEATSSLPYFDGIVRNREEPLAAASIYSMRFTP